ncbi:hypothetical protein C5167_011662 [Papaver somniferum]|uniref:Zinc finger LSD1-type domain-containing protein n=1 Tax=Papaver somniferum TaxID=3469 RepID=A0A4Y7K566_PAPSO|nr:hypothetical protein C5167_011662 [Papaver somniferum]
MQSQLVCSGCRSVLLYPRGAANVCCAICNTITAPTVPPPGKGTKSQQIYYSNNRLKVELGDSVTFCKSMMGLQCGMGGPHGMIQGMDMSQLTCGGCRTLLMYARGATSVRCSCCHTINLARPPAPAPAPNPVAHVNCGRCHITLMYPYGAPSVKCAVCQYVTSTGMSAPTPNSNGQVNRPNWSSTTPTPMPSTSAAMRTHSQTVVVENPMSVDESGKLVCKSSPLIRQLYHLFYI